ncbi:MAG: glycosyltransferase family 2 protein [Muribaculaceae bacterium]|nr:glycosyltransferase family 2 protein [Muribaculaceae bacterium]
MKRVTIVVPCYNEEASLPQLYATLSSLMESQPAYDWEVLMIDDGSTDGTLSLIKQYSAGDARVAYVSLSRNFGKENAMMAGFDYASGDCLVMMDADLQHPPAVIPQMLACWEQGWDDVYARRTCRGRESWLRKHLSLLFYKLLQRSSRFDVLPNVGDFRLLDRKCIDAMRQLRESERYTKGMYAWIGFKKHEIPFEQGDRRAGQSSWRMGSLFKLALDGITSFTTAPLRISTIMGLVVSLVAFCYMVFVLFKTLIVGEPVQGYPTLILVILFLGGIQLLSLGVIGEYLGRIFNETKHRPIYLVAEKSTRETHTDINSNSKHEQD